MLMMLNSGFKERHCTCVPGGPHTCMSPAVSTLASTVNSTLQSISHSLATSRNQSKAGSKAQTRRSSLDKEENRLKRRQSVKKMKTLERLEAQESGADPEEAHLSPTAHHRASVPKHDRASLKQAGHHRASLTPNDRASSKNEVKGNKRSSIKGLSAEELAVSPEPDGTPTSNSPSHADGSPQTSPRNASPSPVPVHRKSHRQSIDNHLAPGSISEGRSSMFGSRASVSGKRSSVHVHVNFDETANKIEEPDGDSTSPQSSAQKPTSPNFDNADAGAGPSKPADESAGRSKPPDSSDTARSSDGTK